jgi:glycosyltransferase involved in cell wall biosynthesis
MIARADNGGLGSLTWEFARHVKPDRVLVMDLGEQGRGPCYLDRYDEFDVFVNRGGTVLTDEGLNWLLEGSDVIYTAETAYRDDFWKRAADAGVKTVAHVMPELYRGYRADAIWLPTTWEQRRIKQPYEIVPVPVAMDRFAPVRRVRREARVFCHLAAPAMKDRNGTEIVLAALEHVTTPITMIFLGAPWLAVGTRVGRVTVQVRDETPRDYWDALPPEADVLVLPRRYAGLSMPMQEAMGQGMPVLATDLSPQNIWPGVHRVPVRHQYERVPMAGGVFSVHSVDPVLLASQIDKLATDPDRVVELSEEAIEHAMSISWEAWLGGYRRRLEALASSE